MLAISIFIGKFVLFVLRLFGRNGSALPGLVVEKLYKPFLPQILSQLPYGVIIVTGTNGKTTTTKIISDLLEAQGLRVLTNKTGSNFVRGIIATTADKAALNGKLNYDIAVFEQDEAHAVHLVERVKPRGVLALNVMRDQMDRFGEIDTTAKLIGKVVSSATDWVVLNANDTRIAALEAQIHAPKTLWFGHSEKLLPQFVSDDQHHHQDDLTYYAAHEPDIALQEMGPGQIVVRINQTSLTLPLQLDGSHNAINAAAAIAVMRAVLPELPLKRIRDTLTLIEPAFGRGERITLQSGALLRLQLVKNPAGFTHSLRLLNEQPYDTVAIAINDADADGRDVSWLWDVDFDTVQSSDYVICGGTRAFDMAVRLKYDEARTDVTRVKLEDFLQAITSRAKTAENQAIIFCTYTAMLRLRQLLKRQGHMIRKIDL